MKNYKINIIFYNTSTHFIVLYPNRTQRHLKNPYKAHKYRLCRDLPFTQTPYIFNINVKHIRIFIIFDYRFYLFFMLYFYFHEQQVSYGYHDCITTTKSVESFPSLMGSSDNLFFAIFILYCSEIV